MSPLRRLTKMEFDSLMMGIYGGKPIMASLVYACLAAGGGAYMFRDQIHPEALFMSGTLVTWIVTLITSWIQVVSLSASPYRDWWLTLPHPRRTLVSAKMLALIGTGALYACIAALACLGIYAFQISFGGMEALPAEKVLLLSMSSLVLSLALVPAAVGCGMYVFSLYGGWIKWIVVVPYTVVALAPVGLLGIMSVIEADELRFLSVSWMWIYTSVALLIGIPAAYGALRYTAGKGVESMGTLSSAPQNQAGKMNGKRSRSGNRTQTLFCTTKGVAAIFQLNLSRFQYYESRWFIRIPVTIIVMAMGVIAFFSGTPIEGRDGISVIFMFPVLIAALWLSSSPAVEQKAMAWQLGFPVKRSFLLGAKVAAVMAMTMKWMLIMAVVCYAGLGVSVLAGRMEAAVFTEALPWVAYSFVLRSVALLFVLCLHQICFFLARHVVLSPLIVAVYWLIFSHSTWLSRYFYPPAADAVSSPPWSLLGMLLLIGLPLALACLQIGGRYVQSTLITGDMWKERAAS